MAAPQTSKAPGQKGTKDGPPQVPIRRGKPITGGHTESLSRGVSFRGAGGEKHTGAPERERTFAHTNTQVLVVSMWGGAECLDSTWACTVTPGRDVQRGSTRFRVMCHGAISQRDGIGDKANATRQGSYRDMRLDAIASIWSCPFAYPSPRWQAGVATFQRHRRVSGRPGPGLHPPPRW